MSTPAWAKEQPTNAIVLTLGKWEITIASPSDDADPRVDDLAMRLAVKIKNVRVWT